MWGKHEKSIVEKKLPVSLLNKPPPNFFDCCLEPETSTWKWLIKLEDEPNLYLGIFQLFNHFHPFKKLVGFLSFHLDIWNHLPPRNSKVPVTFGTNSTRHFVEHSRPVEDATAPGSQMSQGWRFAHGMEKPTIWMVFTRKNGHVSGYLSLSKGSVPLGKLRYWIKTWRFGRSFRVSFQDWNFQHLGIYLKEIDFEKRILQHGSLLR